jgi:hypothetical protein
MRILPIHPLSVLISLSSLSQAGINPIWSALRARLDFRIAMLLAMATDEPVSVLAGNWEVVNNIVNEQSRTHDLGKAVSESFSPKIQRRLASTVPPKPMVELSYEDAFKTLTQMCADCQEAVRIVDFGAQHVQRLKVCLFSTLYFPF